MLQKFDFYLETCYPIFYVLTIQTKALLVFTSSPSGVPLGATRQGSNQSEDWSFKHCNFWS